MAYVDDLSISIITLDDHYNRFELVFECPNHKSYNNLNRCKIRLSEISYLGYIILDKGVQAVPTLVEQIKMHLSQKIR